MWGQNTVHVLHYMCILPHLRQLSEGLLLLLLDVSQPGLKGPDSSTCYLNVLQYHGTYIGHRHESTVTAVEIAACACTCRGVECVLAASHGDTSVLGNSVKT